MHLLVTGSPGWNMDGKNFCRERFMAVFRLMYFSSPSSS